MNTHWELPLQQVGCLLNNHYREQGEPLTQPSCKLVMLLNSHYSKLGVPLIWPSCKLSVRLDSQYCEPGAPLTWPSCKLGALRVLCRFAVLFKVMLSFLLVVAKSGLWPKPSPLAKEASSTLLSLLLPAGKRQHCKRDSTFVVEVVMMIHKKSHFQYWKYSENCLPIHW